MWDTIKKTNLRIIGVEEDEELQIKGPENIFNKIIEENFPNLKKDIPMKVQEAYVFSRPEQAGVHWLPGRRVCSSFIHGSFCFLRE